MDIQMVRVRGNAVEIALHGGNREETITYSSEDVRLVPRGEAAVAGLLLVAMAAGEDIRLDSHLDPTFLRNLSTIQEIYSLWGKRLTQINVRAASSEKFGTRESGGRTAMFFSGGVDSFYTLLKHREKIDTLVYVHGYDLEIGDSDLRSTVSERLRDVADSCGKEFIEIETTLRSITEQRRFTDEFDNWELSHGSALASIAHLLQSCFSRVYISATHSFRHLFPWGSHPLLDPLWSRSDLEVIHDGCEATRLQKVEAISTSRLVLENLRVCWRNPDQAYNCGQCEKCRRTMLELLATGNLERCSTFPGDLELGDVEAIRVRKATIERHYQEVAEKLSTDNDLSDYGKRVEGVILWSRVRRVLKRLFSCVKDIKKYTIDTFSFRYK